MAKLGYGADSPYARVTEYSTVNGITRDDLVAFHKQVRPSEQHHPQLRRRLRCRGDGEETPRRLRLVAERPQAPTAAPTGGTPAKAGVYFVAKDDVTQSNIYVVHGGTGVLRKQSRFLRHAGDERDPQRRFLGTPDERHPHRSAASPTASAAASIRSGTARASSTSGWEPRAARPSKRSTRFAPI